MTLLLRLAILLTTTVTLTSACAPLIIGGVGGAAYVTGSVLADRRTTGTVVEDHSIEHRARAAFRQDSELSEQAHINVNSYNLVVLLTGEAPSEALRRRAGDIVRQLARVRQVHNEVRLAAPSDITTRSGDVLIGGRVKAALYGIDIEGFDPSKVKVVTEAGTVYLMGLLTPVEARAVVETARRVSGVQRVVKVFELFEPQPPPATVQSSATAGQPTSTAPTEPLAD